jgi:hypothetical protein
MADASAADIPSVTSTHAASRLQQDRGYRSGGYFDRLPANSWEPVSRDLASTS